MNQQQRNSQGTKSGNNRRGLEMLLFLVVSAVGIYGLGQGLTGLFEPGQGISLPWLAVTCVAFVVLFAQMERVHDTWPSLRDIRAQQATNEKATKQPPVEAEESEVRSI